MKIRSKLTIWYLIITLIILLALTIGTHVSMEHLLFGAIDRELDIISDTIEQSYDPFSGSFGELRYTEEAINRYIQYYLAVYDLNKTPVYVSPINNFIALDIPLTTDKSEVGLTKRILVTERIPALHLKTPAEITFRIISRQLFYNRVQSGWITIGMSIERTIESMHTLFYVLLSAAAGGIIMMSVGGNLFIRKALNPVSEITKKATEISHRNIDERIQIKNKDDELGRLSRVLNDLLERLGKAFLSQQQFMADAAHELKTPLSILRAHWEAEINNPEVSMDLKEKLIQDIETITRLTHLINDLLLLSRTESLKSAFSFEPVFLDDILKDVINDSMVLAEMKSQDLQVTDMRRVLIQGDKMRLFQLFFNIIDNAIKYCPERAEIKISLRQDDGGAIIEVRDNGPGIPETDLPHLFERFYRVQKDRARTTGGSGLGLSIAELITENHNGTIEISSKEGSGTIFTITLPLNRAS